MGYRGDDLDLRTPQTWSAGDVGDGRRARSGYGSRGPIWVDDTVLACANHAFEVALAHRSGEVRIEHLLYALTRIDAAAEVLEKRGVRVASLRRESATLIASDIPVGLSGGAATPHRSEPFEDALRLAASEAMRRNAPATVDDLLLVFTDIRPDLPGLTLLARHLPRMTREVPEPMRAMAYEPRYVEVSEPSRERLRMPSPGYYASESLPPRRTELAASPADTIQNTRIEALEQMVRALSHDLAGERKSFAAMLQDMQRDVLAQRDDTSRFGGGLNERLQSLEHLVVSSRGDGAMSVQLADRVQGIELAIERKLNEIGRTWSGLTDRLSGLEQDVQHASRGGVSVDLTPIADRIGAVERQVAASAAETGRQWAATGDRLKALEHAVAADHAPQLDLTPIDHRLDVIEEALLSQDGSLSRETSERLNAIERLVQSQREEIIAETEVLKSSVAALAGVLRAQPSEAERIKLVTSLLGDSRAAVVASVNGPLMQRFDALVSLIDARQGEVQARQTAIAARQDEIQGAVAAAQDRLASVERALVAAVERSEESHKVYAQELVEVHDALLKLNTNQHTLAGSVDQWRNHGTTELAAIGGRLDVLARESGRPIQMLEQMSTSMAAMHRITVERYHRRNRFWYWLFGTDDWIAASWPSQLAKVEAERALVKTVQR